MDQIGAVIFPHGIRSQRQKNDVEIVFNAHKYERILITWDGASKRQPGGILGNREKLRSLDIQVMRDYGGVAVSGMGYGDLKPAMSNSEAVICQS